jgi:hypothetical protein
MPGQGSLRIFSFQSRDCVPHSLYRMEYSDVIPRPGSAVEHLHERPSAESGPIPSRHDSDEIARARRSVRRRVGSTRFKEADGNLGYASQYALLDHRHLPFEQ